MELPTDSSLRWIVTRYAELRAAHGEAIGDPELLEPSGRHFPDAFTGDGESVGRLFRRMLGYAPLADDLPVEIRATESAGGGGGGCGTGACGTGGGGGGGTGLARVVDHDDRYVLELVQSELTNPLLLATALARGVGALVLMEAGEDVDPADLPAVSEIASIATGFGVIVLGGAAVYAKGCGGLRMHRVTALSVPELAVGVALFVKVHGIKPSVARAQLEATQREAFDEAMRWADSNEALVSRLRKNPGEVAGGFFKLEPIRGLFGRFLAKRNVDDDIPDLEPVTPSRAPKSEEERRRIEETKALVEAALREG